MSAINQQQIAAPSQSIALFQALRDTLLEQGARPRGARSKALDAIHAQNKQILLSKIDTAQHCDFDPNMSDDEFWRRAAVLPFYSGKTAAHISVKVGHAAKHMLDYRDLASDNWNEEGQGYLAYMADKKAYKNPKDLPRIINAARNLAMIKDREGSKRLVDIFVPEAERAFTNEDLIKIHQNIMRLGMGFVTSLHFMTDLGLQVVKTDRVLTRSVIRLGLITSRPYFGGELHLLPSVSTKEAERLGAIPEFSYRIQSILGNVADQTGLSMRAIDWLLVKIGMKADKGDGIATTVCDTSPLCKLCKAKPMCRLGRRA